MEYHTRIVFDKIVVVDIVIFIILAEALGKLVPMVDALTDDRSTEMGVIELSELGQMVSFEECYVSSRTN